MEKTDIKLKSNNVILGENSIVGEKILTSTLTNCLDIDKLQNSLSIF